MKRVFFIGFLFFVTVTFAGDKFYFTKKSNNYLRKGPGAYYGLLRIVPKGEKLKFLNKQGKWINVELLDGTKGWLSEKSLSVDSVGKDFSSFANKISDADVSQITLAGAVKGLRGKALGGGVEDFDRLMLYTHYSITPIQIKSFIDMMKLYSSNNRNRVDWEDADIQIKDYNPNFEQIQIGYSIAARLASKPLIVNPKIRNYLYLIMNALTESSDFYDNDFNILILNQRQADGFSCPGGVIFITKGDFLAAKDESELAAVIAHELGHQILHHGEVELGKRETHIKADEMFAEMDKEIKSSSEAVENDLNSMIAASYEKVVHGRTLNYELQADKFAAILLANAGYDPFAIVRLTSRLAKMFKAEKDIFSDDYLSPNDMETRAKKIKEFVYGNFEIKNSGGRFKKRFNAYFNLLFGE